jgi:hypothetical protein
MRRLPLPADAEGFYQSGMDAFCPAPTPLLSNPRRPKNRANPAERQGGGKNLIGNIVLRSKSRVGLLTHLHKITWKLCSEALK